MIQLSIVSRINLLSGSADLVMVILVVWFLQERAIGTWFWALVAGLMVGFVSSVPWYIPMVTYFLLLLGGRILQRRVWQAPLLATFLLTILGTLIMQLLTIGFLFIQGSSITLRDVISLVLLPSSLLNLLLVIPVYYLTRDLADWMHPSEVNI